MSDARVWDIVERPDIDKRLADSKEIRAKMGIYGPGGQTNAEFYEMSKVHTQGLMEWCFGMVWSDKTLEPKIKEIAVLAAMVAQDLDREIYWHVRSGLNLGLTRDEILALIVQCTPYCGYPKVNHGLLAATKAFADIDAEKKKGKGKRKVKKKK